MDRLIRYMCNAREHQQLPLFVAESSWSPNVITFHDGVWAYCPSGQPSEHEWIAVNPQPYEQMRDETEERIRAESAEEASR